MGESVVLIKYEPGERDVRPWGTWEVLAVGANFLVKRIVVNPHSRLSLQRHQHRAETWTIVTGQGLITRDDDEIQVASGDVISLPLGCTHRIANVGDEELTFIEVQLGAILDESDIERIADDYSRN